MTIESIRELYEARPFQPFTIHLADGRRVSVQHPEFLAFAPKARTFVVAQPDGAFKIIDLMLVTELEVRARRNGKRAA